MNDKTYVQIKELLDTSVVECKQAAQAATEASKTCEKLVGLCTKIAKDLAERGDNK